jgi:hypothetical protein
MIELLKKIYTKYPFLVIFIFSLINTIILMLIFVIHSSFEINQQLFIIIYFLCVFGFIIYTYFIEKSVIKYLGVFIFIILGLLIIIDLYFIKSGISYYLLLVLEVIGVGIFSTLLFPIGLMDHDFAILIILIPFFPYVFITNIKITKIFKNLKSENSKKYKLLGLYFLHNNLLLINIFNYFIFNFSLFN